MFREVSRCRICGNQRLVDVLSLGTQHLTGVFPKSRSQKVTAGPLALVKCAEERGDDKACGLLQLKHTFSLGEMYGDNYGYRSGLNQSMVKHLHGKVRKILSRVAAGKGDLVVDIGSNDSTLLQAYPKNGPTLAGIDPTGKKFREYYPSHIALIPEFFSAETLAKHFPGTKAKVITSISMFYDLEAPLDFMRQVHESLADDGIWVFEQSYMPAMLSMNSYDTVCHEHLEYYALKQVKWMVDRAGFRILDVEFNNINGGSFSITAAKADSRHRTNEAAIAAMLKNEEESGLGGLLPYRAFAKRVAEHREGLRHAVAAAGGEGKPIFGYGASTKGNVILQYCGFTEKDLPYIAEVNTEKFGVFTPGSLIPVISEEEAKSKDPGCYLVLVWHFRDFILNRERPYIEQGGRFLFPLPSIEMVDAAGLKRA